MMLKRIRMIAWMIYFLVERAVMYRCLPSIIGVNAMASAHAEIGSRIVTITYDCGHSDVKREIGDDLSIKSKLSFFKLQSCPACSRTLQTGKFLRGVGGI